MDKIRREDLKENPRTANAYETYLTINQKEVKISIDPDDVELEKTLEVVNKILGNFDFYEDKARKIIAQEYLDNFNQNWRMEEEEELDEKSFNHSLTLIKISFLSNTSIDFTYSENGLFGNHYLVAETADGENFEYASMHG